MYSVRVLRGTNDGFNRARGSLSTCRSLRGPRSAGVQSTLLVLHRITTSLFEISHQYFRYLCVWTDRQVGRYIISYCYHPTVRKYSVLDVCTRQGNTMEGGGVHVQQAGMVFG